MSSSLGKTILLVLCLFALPPSSFAHNPKRCYGPLAKVEYKIPHHWTTEAQLKASIEKMKAEKGPSWEVEGFFGPDSMLWEVSKVPYLLVVAEPVLYMQLAHPAAAQGVYEQSRLLQDPVERFQNTFKFIWGITYNDGPTAEKMALAIHKIHSRVLGENKFTAGAYRKGEIYGALDPDALLWVHATHWYGVLFLYETLVRPLTAAEKEQYYADTKKIGILFGIPEDRVPDTKRHFEQYFRYMLETAELEYTPDALAMEKHFRDMNTIAEKKNPFIWMLRNYFDLVTANMLPPKLGKNFGLAAGPVKKTMHIALLQALRTAYQKANPWFQELPIYRMANARTKGIEPSAADLKMHGLITGAKGVTLRDVLLELPQPFRRGFQLIQPLLKRE